MKRKPKRSWRKKRARAGEPQVITRTVTHICLVEVNPGKLAALDELAPIYLALCQQKNRRIRMGLWDQVLFS